jgi:hypothetical protein
MSIRVREKSTDLWVYDLLKEADIQLRSTRFNNKRN